MEAFARNHRLPIEWAEKGVRKEDHVLPWQRRMAKADAYGVYFIFKSMEQGATFRVTVPKYPTKDPNYRILAHQRSRFTHYYFYIRDAVLGPMACPARRDDTDESGVAAALASFRATFEATQKGCAITGDYDDASRRASHGKNLSASIVAGTLFEPRRTIPYAPPFCGDPRRGPRADETRASRLLARCHRQLYRRAA